MKQHWPILALLGIGAIIVLIYLSRKSASAVPMVVTDPSVGNAANAAEYPNAPAGIKMGNIEVGGSPITINYGSASSASDTASTGDCACTSADSMCGSGDVSNSGNGMSGPSVSHAAVKNAAANFASLHPRVISNVARIPQISGEGLIII